MLHLIFKPICAIVIIIFCFESFFKTFLFNLQHFEIDILYNNKSSIFIPYVQKVMKDLKVKSLLIHVQNNTCYQKGNIDLQCPVEVYQCKNDNRKLYRDSLTKNIIQINKEKDLIPILYPYEEWNGCHCNISEFFGFECNFILYSCIYMNGHKLKIVRYNKYTNKNTTLHTDYNPTQVITLPTLTKDIYKKLICE
jgi:hypothetical protein